MKIAILGFILEGQTAYHYWNRPENNLTVCDQNSDVVVPEGVPSQLGPDYLKNLGDFDLIVRTPGLHPRDIVAANPETPNILDKVTTVTNEFMRVCPTKNIIGVTGTKGKGTTTTLIAKMLEVAGKTVHLGGNIGIPSLDLLKNIKPDDWVVLEMSSFQLIDIKYSPRIGVCLMIVPEHLNWHADFNEYLEAKRQLFIHQTTDDLMVYNAGDSNSIDLARSSKARKLWYKVPPLSTPNLETKPDETGVTVIDDHIYMADTKLCAIDEIALLGRHNLENVCAATAAVWEVIEHNREAVCSVVSTFKGLEHRLELVRKLGDVKYYDDSFGTTPETAIVAIEAFEAPKIVILGGSDKGANYDELAQVVKNSNVRAVIRIGQTGPAIEKALKAAGYTNIVEGGNTIEKIVKTAQATAKPGDIVLLSTACASFDMFNNYKDRGEKFHKAVLTLT